MRVKRKLWNVARIGSRFIGALAEVESQREPYAQYWDEQNRVALAESGPLWVTLGDSMAQGIGASHPSAGFVPAVLEKLRNETGEPWRVINLAMTGARVGHVVEHQLPALLSAELDPAVTTCIIGFNDFIGRTRPSTLKRNAEMLIEEVPLGTLVGRVSTRRFTTRATVLAEAFGAGMDAGRISIFDPWRWPDSDDILARDRIHLNDKGYGYVADAVFEAVIAV